MEFGINPYIFYGGSAFIVGGMFAGLNGHDTLAAVLSIIGLGGGYIAHLLFNR